MTKDQKNKVPPTPLTSRITLSKRGTASRKSPAVPLTGPADAEKENIPAIVTVPDDSKRPAQRRRVSNPKGQRFAAANVPKEKRLISEENHDVSTSAVYSTRSSSGKAADCQKMIEGLQENQTPNSLDSSTTALKNIAQPPNVISNADTSLPKISPMPSISVSKISGAFQQPSSARSINTPNATNDAPRSIKSLSARMRGTAGFKSIDLLQSKNVTSLINAPPSPCSTSVHSAFTGTSKRKYGKAANISYSTLNRDHEHFSIHEPVSIADNNTDAGIGKKQKSSSSENKKSQPSEQKAAVHKKGFKAPTSANLKAHNREVATKLIFKPLAGKKSDDESIRASSQSQKRSASKSISKPSKVANEVITEVAPSVSIPLEQEVLNEQLTQPQNLDRTQHEQCQKSDSVSEPEGGAVCEKNIVPIHQFSSGGPECPSHSHPKRPITDIVRVEKKRLLQKVLNEDFAPSAKKSKYFTDPFSDKRQSVLPLKLQPGKKSLPSKAITSPGSVVAAPISQAKRRPSMTLKSLHSVPSVSLGQAPKVRNSKSTAYSTESLQADDEQLQ